MANIPIIMLNHNCDRSVVYVKEGEQIVEGKFWNSNPRPSEYQSEFSGKAQLRAPLSPYRQPGPVSTLTCIAVASSAIPALVST